MAVAEVRPMLGAKAERSAATRLRLMDATIDSLVELGWAGTSTTEIVRRAGVSRGAQVHHYPTKEDLVLAAVEHLLLRRTAEFRAAFSTLPAQDRSHATALDLLWAMCRGQTVEAWLELAVAARSDPVLHARFAEVEERFWADALSVFRSLFPEAEDDSMARLGLRFTFAVLDGLTLARLSGVDPADLTEVLDAFKLLTSPFFAHDQGATP
ncbi:MAG: TetR/AcrR family transcriptional regulator [Acidimicrobiales bacterium]